MKFTSYCLLLFLFVFTTAEAQKKNISLADIWQEGSFQPEGLEALESLKNGEEYAIMNLNRSQQSITVDAYNYETGEKTKTLINSAEISGLDYFEAYTFNADETAALLAQETEFIYRHSNKAYYYVYDLKEESLTKISDEKIKEPTFSSDGKKVAYSLENNLYIKDLDSGETTQITEDGENNKIINGTTDWVYEEEFSFTRAFDWSADSQKIGFLKFDESEVREITMENYGTYPDQLYPEPYTYKYPKAGEDNSKVSLHIYDLKSKKTHEIDLGDYEYIPRLKWTEDADILSVQTLNRHQNDWKLSFVNTAKHSTEVILHEKDEHYIDITDDLTFLKDNSFLITSEKSNWNHLYHYNKKGKLKRQITDGNWDVTSFYGLDEANKTLYYQSTENGSVNRDVYSIHLKGKNKKRLSNQPGTNSADFSSNFNYFIKTFNDVENPNVYSVNRGRDGKEIRVVEDNKALKNKLKDYSFSGKELTTIKVNDNDLNMYIIKPTDFDENKEYPLLMYQYSGPGSQLVSNSFYDPNDLWHEMLADEGYVVVCVDGRGTGFKGADFKKQTQLELGKYEVEDQIEVAKKLGERDYIDKDRIGIWGWSYGGFMSSNALLQANDVFKMAIAVAPVTSWRFYDTVYTERFMTTPQENESGYDDNSPITHVDKLKGNYLLIHGASDDNVHVQNAMQMIEALIQANKQFDWAIYPDKDHGIHGGNTRMQLYTKMTNYIKEKL